MFVLKPFGEVWEFGVCFFGREAAKEGLILVFVRTRIGRAARHVQGELQLRLCVLSYRWSSLT